MKSSRMLRAVMLIAICIVAAAFAWGALDWQAWVKGWGGTHFKLVTGGVLGWIFDRYFLDNDISALATSDRGDSQKSRATICGLFAAGAAFGL